MRFLQGVIVVVLLAAPASAEERTWTISTGTYAMAAELVEVRGDIAYLKTGDKVEHIPLARLSAGDIAYITSQARPATPLEQAYVAAPPVEPAEIPAPVAQSNALPLVAPTNSGERSLLRTNSQNSVVNAPAYPQAAPRTTVQATYEEEMLPVPTSGQPRAQVSQPRTQVAQPRPRTLSNTNTNANNMTNPNARRQTTQRQAQSNNTNQNRTREEDRGGLFGRLRRGR